MTIIYQNTVNMNNLFSSLQPIAVHSWMKVSSKERQPSWSRAVRIHSLSATFFKSSAHHLRVPYVAVFSYKVEIMSR